jgi:uncharacterized protein YcnI
MKKLVSSIGALAIASFALVSPVYAHVSLIPNKATPGATSFMVRALNEKEIQTVELRLLVPDGVEVNRVGYLAGWSHTFKREEVEKKAETAMEGKTHADEDEGASEEGRVKEIIWTGKMSEGEYVEFPIIAKYVGEPATLEWKAYQKYANGEIIPWDGSSEKAELAKVEIVTSLPTQGSAVSATAASQTGSAPWLSVGAFLLSVAALAIGLKNKK